MLNRNILSNINKAIIDIVKDYASDNKTLNVKNVSDKVFSREETNIAVNTAVANISDIERLIDDNSKRYEDGGYNFNKLKDGKGIIGVETLITIDSGNKASSQSALADNGFVLLSLYNYLLDYSFPSEWRLFDMELDIPAWFPYHSNNIYSIIIMRGLYEIR